MIEGSKGLNNYRLIKRIVVDTNTWTSKVKSTVNLLQYYTIQTAGE